VVLNVVLLILSYTKEKDAILFTHPPAVGLHLDLLLLNYNFPNVYINVHSILLYFTFFLTVLYLTGVKFLTSACVSAYVRYMLDHV
jgi:hypothetical protein